MKTWKKRTKAVHAGIRRSQYNEVSEAIYLTQGFVYDSRRGGTGPVHSGR